MNDGMNESEYDEESWKCEGLDYELIERYVDIHG